MLAKSQVEAYGDCSSTKLNITRNIAKQQTKISTAIYLKVGPGRIGCWKSSRQRVGTRDDEIVGAPAYQYAVVAPACQRTMNQVVT